MNAKNILFIGKYLPEFCYESLKNHSLATELSASGYNLYLLSDSWCNVSQNNFLGNVGELSKTDPFIKKYFVDPKQLKYSDYNLVGSMIGLACKIIKEIKFQYIYITDIFHYALIGDWIRYNYNITIIGSAHNKDVIRLFQEDYTKEYILNVLERLDILFLYDFFYEYLNYLNINVKNRSICSVIKKQQKKIESANNSIVITGELVNINMDYLYTAISEKFTNETIKIILFNKTKYEFNDKLNTSLNIEIVDTVSLQEYFSSIDNCKYVIDVSQIIDNEVKYLTNNLYLMYSGAKVLLNYANFNIITKMFDVEYEMYQDFYYIKKFEKSEMSITEKIIELENI